MGCVVIYGGEVSLIHNTIAQFYSLKAGSQAALSFGNQIGNLSYPLTKLEVKNCIITGYSDEVGVEKKDSVTFNYRFYNSVLRTDSTKVENRENIIWENVKDTVSAGYKNFKTIDDSLQQYDFHLDSLSKANGSADARWMLPLNREGVARDEKKLNMGCY